MRRTLALIALLSLPGCRRGDPAPERPALFAGCGSTACEVERALQAWPADPAAVRAALIAHPEPVARQLIVTRIVEVDPQRGTELCALLPPGDAQERCQKIERRPHLWSNPRAQDVSAPRPGGGPANNALRPPPGLRSRLADAAPPAHGCAGQPDVNGCLGAAARAALRERDVGAAAALCAAIAEERWRGECLFQLAEATLQARRASGFTDAAELCLAAEPYAEDCVGHAVGILADGAPPADAPRPAFWRPLRVSADAIQAAWGARDAHYAGLVLDRFWSEALARAYSRAGAITGDSLGFLPAEAAPHARAAAAWQLMDRDPGAAAGLDAWAERLRQALALRSQGPVQPADRPLLPVRDLWPTDLAGEETLPAIAYLGSTRRAVSPDEATDLRLCVLEAAARVTPPQQALLEEGAASADPLVRWTAQRLLAPREDRRPDSAAAGQ